MNLTLTQFLIACPLCFLAGFVDSIGGGGGLISLPAFMFAGLPAHMAIGTNKVQSFLSCSMSTFRMWKSRRIVPLLILPSVAGAVIGSAAGAWLNTLVSEKILSYVMIVALPIIAYVVFNKKIFAEGDGEAPAADAKTCIRMALISLVVGLYDGFYGPGAGTFLIIGFTVIAKLDVRYANGHAKVANLATSISSMVVYLLNGQSVVFLGLAAGVCAMAGSYIGSGLMLKNGTKIVRPIIILVIILLMAKIITGF